MFKTNSYCVGQENYSATQNIVGDITFIKKTFEETKLSVVECSICVGKKSMVVSDNSITAECLIDFFNILGEKGINASKKMA